VDINAKIGTMPMKRVHVKYKRKPPIVGDKISVRPAYERSGKYQDCIIDEIKDNDTYKIYFMALI